MLVQKNDIHKAYQKIGFLKDSSESMNQNSKSHTIPLSRRPSFKNEPKRCSGSGDIGLGMKRVSDDTDSERYVEARKVKLRMNRIEQNLEHSHQGGHRRGI